MHLICSDIQKDPVPLSFLFSSTTWVSKLLLLQKHWVSIVGFYSTLKRWKQLLKTIFLFQPLQLWIVIIFLRQLSCQNPLYSRILKVYKIYGLWNMLRELASVTGVHTAFYFTWVEFSKAYETYTLWKPLQGDLASSMQYYMKKAASAERWNLCTCKMFIVLKVLTV